MSQVQTFDDSISRIRRGIGVAWLANFGVLWLTLTAFGFVVIFFLNSAETFSDIGLQLLWSSAISAVVSWIVLLGAVLFADKSISASVGADQDVIHTSGKLFNIVEEIALSAGMEYVPEVHLLKGTGVPNAYAIDSPFRGKKQAKVYITQELYESLTREEIKAVMSHEMAHIINRDSKVMTHIIAVGIVVTFASIALRQYGWHFIRQNSNKARGPVLIVFIILAVIMGALVIFSPFIAKMTQAFMSRKREELADSTGVSLCRNPTALATALVSIDSVHKNKDITADKRLYQAVGSLALYSPLAEGWAKKVATHPPMDKRIADLIAIGADEKKIEQRSVRFNDVNVEDIEDKYGDDDIIF